MANTLETQQISITLPKTLTEKIDVAVEKHVFGAMNRQDVIRAVLSNFFFREANLC